MMRQCTQLKAIKEFTFKPAKKHARKVTVRLPSTFWVVSSETMQKETGLIHIARVNQGMHYDYAFSPEQIAELFVVSAS